MTTTALEHAPTTARPLPPEMPVREAVEAYLRENGFTRAAYDAPTTKGTVLGIPFFVPNTARHRWAIMLHDLHHVATGFGTDLTGEAEISAWELRGGRLLALGWVASLVLMGAFMGLFVAPRRTLRAWRGAAGARNLFRPGVPAEAYAELTLGQLRQALGIPAEGLAQLPRGLHERAPRAS